MEREGGDHLILMQSLCLFLAGLKSGGVSLQREKKGRAARRAWQPRQPSQDRVCVHECPWIFSGLKFSRIHVHFALPAELPPSPPLTSNVLHQCVSASTLPPCGREVPNRTTLSNPTVSPSTRTQTKHTDALTVTLLRLTLRPSEMLHKFNASPSSDHPPVRC